MAVLVHTCCCGCDLKTGILLIAIFGLVSKSEFPCQYIIKSSMCFCSVRLLRGQLALAWGCGSLSTLQKQAPSSPVFLPEQQLYKTFLPLKLDPFPDIFSYCVVNLKPGEFLFDAKISTLNL